MAIAFRLLRRGFAVLIAIWALAACERTAPVADPLPSWNDSQSRNDIVDYVTAVTDPANAHYVPESERIAVFDNDGTLWSEQPIYFQIAFALDRVRALAPQHPEWQEQEPYRSILAGDIETALAGGMEAISAILMATHAGMTNQEFADIVREWTSNATHPTSGQRYIDMIYAPMLEVLAYLRANGFKTYIVSGGGIEFMRPWTEAVYGIPPEQVVGSSIKIRYELGDAGPVLRREPEIDFVDDGPGKPVGIQSHIGRRPIVAFGNSDGDQQMLQWTHASPHQSLIAIIHHTDAEREWAYDSPSHIGHLDKALQEAREKNWTVVDMQNDWARIYPYDE